LSIVYDSLLAVVLVISVITDIRSRKIYNKILLPAWVAAATLHTALGGWHGAVLALAGSATGFALLLIPYLMGGMGAGDVKLLAVVGAVKGTSFVLNASLGMAVLGAVLAVYVMLSRPTAGSRLVWLAYWGYSLYGGVRLPLQLHGGASRGGGSVSYPYGVAIAGGAVIGWWLQGRGLL
jgi:prepilin peptidase CpaA